MAVPSQPREALSLLAELYREKLSGTLVLAAEPSGLRVVVRDGEIVGVHGPAPPRPAPVEPLPGPDDSSRMKLDRVLAEIGMRPPAAPSARPTAVAPRPSAAEFRDQLLSLLVAPGKTARFEDSGDLEENTIPVTGDTEPLILEALRRVGSAEAVRALLGDLDLRLSATTALAEERTLTLTEGYLLSRIDGVSTARQILQIVPLDSDETERSLAGLLLTGRVIHQSPAPRLARTRPPREDAPAVAKEQLQPPADAAGPEAVAPEPQATATHEPAGERDEEALGHRREILELFQSLPLLNHFEVLGVEPGCTDAEVRRAHVSLVKRYHPDSRRGGGVEDLQDILEAIFIRVGEAWEVLGKAKSRAAYEARFYPGGARASAGSTAGTPGPEAAPPESAEAEGATPEETLQKAQLLLGEARYWDAISMLEQAVPRLQPQHQQHRGRILLARAYARNPMWVRRAEETLQGVVREDPANAEAHYELGLLYKGGGLNARAQAMFRKVVQLRPDHQAAAEIGPDEPAAPAGGLLRRLFRGGS